jgi:small subunit ribosomal protein S3e
VLGIRVKIMLPWDVTGKIGPKKPLPDHVTVAEPKEEPPREIPIPSLVLLSPAALALPYKGEEPLPGFEFGSTAFE